MAEVADAIRRDTGYVARDVGGCVLASTNFVSVFTVVQQPVRQSSSFRDHTCDFSSAESKDKLLLRTFLCYRDYYVAVFAQPAPVNLKSTCGTDKPRHSLNAHQFQWQIFVIPFRYLLHETLE